MSIGRNLLSWAAAIAVGAMATAMATAMAAAPAAAEVGAKAGVAAAVHGPVQQISYRTPRATIGRNLGSGDGIYLGDRIVTGPSAGLQIMLLDGTTFSIGPNASMVIDEFVYNPASGSGKITASLTRGTLRLISGKIGRQDQEAIRVKLPVATVGIRGTVAVFSGDPNGFFIGLFGVGANNSADRPGSYLEIAIDGTVYQIFRSGYGCTVTAASPVCDPQPVGPQFIQQLLGTISGNLREVDLRDFEQFTGLGLVEAIQLLQTQGGFEQFWDIVDHVYQDQTRPGPPPPPCVLIGKAPHANGPQFADAAGGRGVADGRGVTSKKRRTGAGRHAAGRQTAVVYCYPP